MFKGFHFGILYIGLDGHRNQDLWVFESGKWQWKEDRRLDSVLALEARYKFILSNFTNNVFQLESVFHHHFRSKAESIKLGISSTYFILEDQEPKYSFILNYYHFIALNFARKSTFARSTYFTPLKHLLITFL